MGTFSDLLASQPDDAALSGPVGSGRYAAALGVKKAADDKAAYEAELAKQRKYNTEGEARMGATAKQLNALGGSYWGPFAGEIVGAGAAAGNSAVNLARRIAGAPIVPSGAIYRANRDATDEETARERANYPVTSLVGEIGGLSKATKIAGKGLGLLADLKPVAQAIDVVKASAPMSAAGRTAAALKTASGLKPAVTDWLGGVAKTGATGAGVGGLLGAGEGEGVEDRLSNAEKGALFGGITGTALGAGAPLLKLGGKALKDAGGWLKDLVTEAPPEGVIRPQDAEAAAQMFAEMAARKGVTSGNVAAKAAPYAEPLAGQLLGTEGQNVTSALARRGGETGDQIRATVFSRAGARPTGIKQTMADTLGVSPDEAAGNVDAIIKSGRAGVAPKYDDLTESPFGVTTPELERLLNTKEGKSLVGFLQDRARVSGNPAEGLTYAPVEVPLAGVGVHPMEAPPVGEFSEQPPPVPRGPAKAPSQGLSLVPWIARQGGVGGEGAGEMAAMDAGGVGARSQMSPQELDALAEKAQDAGYFPPSAEGVRPTHVELLDAIKRELGGNKLYAREADPAAQARFDARRQAEEDQARYDQRSIEEPTTREEYQSLEQPGLEAPAEGYGGHAPETEPAVTQALTPASLVKLHQEAGNDVKREFGQVVDSRKNKLKDQFYRMFGTALAGEGGALPGYRPILDEAAQYKKVQGAYDTFSGRLFNGKMEDWGKAVASIRPKGSNSFDPHGLAGAQAAMANDAAEAWANGTLKGGKFLPPGVKDRLSLLFGPATAEKFIKQMQASAEQAAAEARMAPFSGSQTAALQATMGETDQSAAEQLAKLGALAGKGWTGMAGEVLKGAGAYGKTAGTSVGYRNALGKLMQMPPDDLQAFLREYENRAPPPRSKDLSGQLGILGALALHPEPQPRD